MTRSTRREIDRRSSFTLRIGRVQHVVGRDVSFGERDGLDPWCRSTMQRLTSRRIDLELSWAMRIAERCLGHIEPRLDLAIIRREGILVDRALGRVSWAL